MRYQVIHETTYNYEAPVVLSQQLLHLWPRECPWQRCLGRELQIEPTGDQVLKGWCDPAIGY